MGYRRHTAGNRCSYTGYRYTKRLIECRKISYGSVAIYDGVTAMSHGMSSDVPCDVQRCPMELVATSMTKTSIDWASIARELRQQQTLKEQLASKNRNRKNKRHI